MFYEHLQIFKEVFVYLHRGNYAKCFSKKLRKLALRQVSLGHFIRFSNFNMQTIRLRLIEIYSIFKANYREIILRVGSQSTVNKIAVVIIELKNI
jgi:hypothetical protein